VTLPDEARVPAPYLGRHGPSRPTAVCLPAEFASLSLLPDSRDVALEVFQSLNLIWHDPIAGGPSSHLLDSQVQCANALAPMVRNPEQVMAAFGDVLPIAEVLTMEGDRYLTFEYVGLHNYLGEAKPGQPRTRGAHFTSPDAAIRYRCPDDSIEIALIEWKYTEEYHDDATDPDWLASRMERYRALWDAPDCPVRHDLIPYEDLFVEPFYQLFRQQLLAGQMTKARELGADRVQVLHISPGGNDGYRSSLNRDSHLAVDTDLLAIWQQMVVDPDTFVSIDAQRFCDPERGLTSAEYRARYTDKETDRD
jgi:hypothetical protein